VGSVSHASRRRQGSAGLAAPRPAAGGPQRAPASAPRWPPRPTAARNGRCPPGSSGPPPFQPPGHPMTERALPAPQRGNIGRRDARPMLRQMASHRPQPLADVPQLARSPRSAPAPPRSSLAGECPRRPASGAPAHGRRPCVAPGGGETGPDDAKPCPGDRPAPADTRSRRHPPNASSPPPPTPASAPNGRPPSPGTSD
jgi:hypothetical protein